MKSYKIPACARMTTMKKLLFSFVFISFLLPTLINPLRRDETAVLSTFWKYQCLDTMKYSRDTARAWNGKENELQKEINLQIAAIKTLGANCVSLGTPYNAEFVPFMKKWVDAARKNNLHVWFRGNIPEWEGWFDFPKLKNPAEHHAKIYAFVTQNPDLFQEGDIFTPAPEAENGGAGDPRMTGKRQEFNDFLFVSYDNCMNAFAKIEKKVTCGFFSTNFDVARESLDKDTVQKIGRVVTIDHYVSNLTRYTADIKMLNLKYGAEVAIGEFGAPIPDLNGTMNEEEQANYIGDLMKIFYENREIIPAINYWTLRGGSTAILNDNDTLRQAANTITKYFRPAIFTGVVTNELGDKLTNISFQSADHTLNFKTDFRGEFGLLAPVGKYKMTVSGTGIKSQSFTLDATPSAKLTKNFVVEIKNPGTIYRIRRYIMKLFSSLSFQTTNYFL